MKIRRSIPLIFPLPPPQLSQTLPKANKQRAFKHQPRSPTKSLSDLGHRTTHPQRQVRSISSSRITTNSADTKEKSILTILIESHTRKSVYNWFSSIIQDIHHNGQRNSNLHPRPPRLSRPLPQLAYCIQLHRLPPTPSEAKHENPRYRLRPRNYHRGRGSSDSPRPYHRP